MATFTNQATLTYNNVTTNSNIVTGEICQVLTMTKIAVTDSYSTDGTVTYVVSIVNGGNTPFRDLTLTDNLGGYTQGSPAETRYPLSYIEGSLLYYVNGELQNDPDVTVGPPLVIEDLYIPAGGNAIIIYETEVTDFASPELEGFITNEVTLRGGGLTEDITADETVNAAIGPDLTITKALSPRVITENGQLTYTLTITNTGNAAATANDNLVITDVFDPILSNITVTLGGTVLNEGTDYTYNETTGAFATVEGRVTVPAATFTRNDDGIWITEPGVAILTITGTI